MCHDRLRGKQPAIFEAGLPGRLLPAGAGGIGVLVPGPVGFGHGRRGAVESPAASAAPGPDGRSGSPGGDHPELPEPGPLLRHHRHGAVGGDQRGLLQHARRPGHPPDGGSRLPYGGGVPDPEPCPGPRGGGDGGAGVPSPPGARGAGRGGGGAPVSLYPPTPARQRPGPVRDAAGPLRRVRTPGRRHRKPGGADPVPAAPGHRTAVGPAVPGGGHGHPGPRHGPVHPGRPPGGRPDRPGRDHQLPPGQGHRRRLGRHRAGHQRPGPAPSPGSHRGGHRRGSQDR